MTPLYVYPLAYLVGILFNLNPSCGSASMVWSSTQQDRRLVALLAVIRIAILAAIGAVASTFGTAMRLPWGILMVLTAAYLLYSTVLQSRAGISCRLPKRSRWLPWVLAITPPPSGYIGLAFFFGGFNPPTPAEGAAVLALIGLGLTTPVWMMILKPGLWTSWQNLLTINRAWNRTRILFQYAGVVIFTIVGLAFVFVREFHRPLLELVQ